MIKIAAFPKCWIDDIVSRKMDLFDWIERSSELEVDGLEMYSDFLLLHDDNYLQSVRRRVEELGMVIPMMCFSPDFTTLEVEAYEREIQKQIEMIRVTAVLGGSYCRTLSGQKRPEVDEQEGIDLVVHAIERCLPYAEKYDVKIVMENHYKDGYWKHVEFAQKAKIFIAIINRLNSPYFGVQFDPSNSYVAGDDVLEVMDLVLPRIMTMHASDRYLADGAKLDDIITHDGLIGYPDKLVHGVTGKGVIDYPAIFSRLKKINFNGWISIEDGMNGMEEMKASVDFLKVMRDQYFLSQN